MLVGGYDDLKVMKSVNFSWKGGGLGQMTEEKDKETFILVPCQKTLSCMKEEGRGQWWVGRFQ